MSFHACEMQAVRFEELLHIMVRMSFSSLSLPWAWDTGEAVQATNQKWLGGKSLWLVGIHASGFHEVGPVVKSCANQTA